MVLVLAGCAPKHDETRSETLRPNEATIREILVRRVDAKQSVGIVVGINDLDASGFVPYGTFSGPGTSEITEDTVFEIGSVTKTFTATLLADMVSRREVALEDYLQCPPDSHLTSDCCGRSLPSSSDSSCFVADRPGP
jgi:serine-type D-Ala-D-Ala carboxypeptidase/endopeptidase